VQLVEAYDVDAEPAQRRLARRPDVLGAAVDLGSPTGAAVAEHETDLRGERDPFPVGGSETRQGPADQLLVVEGPVHVGGVDERDAQVYGAPDHRDRAVVVPVRRRVDRRHAHAAEADAPHDRTSAVQLTRAHRGSLSKSKLSKMNHLKMEEDR